MTTRIEVYNGALIKLGERRLATLSDNRPERRTLDALWADTMAYMIEAAMWNWASRTEELQPSDTVTPNFGYTYAFEKPDDYVRIVKISDNDTLVPTLEDFMEEGDYFFAWSDPLYLQYISNDTLYGADPGKWTASFTRAFVLELAYRASPQVGANAKVQEMLFKEKKDALLYAKGKDVVNQAMSVLPPGRLTSSRRGNRYGGTPPWRR